MDIYYRLPENIQHKIFMHFRHPIAQQLHDNPWIIPKIINKWPAPPTTEYRLALAKMVNNPYPRKRCGCIYYEQHQVCCNDIPEEELDTWDPVVRATPIQQAIWKNNVCSELKEKVCPYYCEYMARQIEILDEMERFHGNVYRRIT